MSWLVFGVYRNNRKNKRPCKFSRKILLDIERFKINNRFD